MPAGHVIVVVVLTLLGGGVLNAQALTDAAARQPFGWKRTVAVVAATPFRGIAGLVGLDVPHRLLARAAPGGGDGPASIEPSEAVRSSSGPAAPTDDGATPAPVASEQATDPAEARLAISRRDPLRVWVGGDSLSSEFGPALSDRLARTGRVATEVEFRFSTGLARPDFYDWPSRLVQIRRQQDPDVFVVMFGANDGQNLEVGGTVLTFGSPEWEREYTERVDEVMASLAGDGRTVLWVGQPIMRSPDFDAKMRSLNAIYSARAGNHDGVRFVDTRKMFSGAGDAFSAYLDDDNGDATLMRQQDGVHLTRAGGERVTDVIVEILGDQWDLTTSD